MASVNVLMASGVGKAFKSPNYDGKAPTFTSPNYKADGQLKVSNGLHTITSSLHSFVGSLFIQGTLKANPTENDWVDAWLDSPNANDATRTKSIDCLTATTRNDIYLVYGNFYWLRVVAAPYLGGSINYVRLTF